MSMKPPVIVDKNGVALSIGQKLRIQFVEGRYGQVSMSEGVIDSLDAAGRSVTLVLSRRERTVFKGIVSYIEAGQKRYHCLPGDFVENFARYVCNHVNADFEHGCHTWAEVIHSAASVQ